MTQMKDILGMNARNTVYLRLNKKSGRRLADSKLLTKRRLRKCHIPHPRLITVLGTLAEVEKFDWNSLKEGFVIKPSQGLGGDGILIVRKAGKYAGEWLAMTGDKLTIDDLKLHTADILEGRYSRNKALDRAFIEERIKIHPKFAKYAYKGTPDVRVIVFNHIPVMAMLRLPTKESDGKANLHQGAIGLGVDLATGITTYGVVNNEEIRYIPNTGRKVNGLRVPFWQELLRVAIDAQRASKLGYLGVDIVIDSEKGPEVLELNDQPGLQIQLANKRPLLRRLRRVEDLEIISPYKGIQIAEALFAERFSEKVKDKQGRRTVGIFEKVKVKADDKKRVEVIAKIDTGAYSTSIDRELAKEMGLLKPRHVLWQKKVRSALGREERPVIELTFWLQGVKVKAMANVSTRKGMRAKMLIGRKYIREFVVDPGRVKNY